MAKLVSYTQFAFIKDRNIFKGWTLASKVLDEMKGMGNNLLFKTDFEKAFNSVD